MDPDRVVRVALARLFAIRHDRAVPLPELVREGALEGLEAGQVVQALASLQAQRLAIETPEGWRPGSLPLASRARQAMASFGWLHA